MLAADLVSALAEQTGLGACGLVVRRLDVSEDTLVLGESLEFAAASMIKIPVVAALAEACALGVLRENERATVTSDQVTENDADSPLELGVEATLAELGRLAIVRSDNVATNVLIDRLGRAAISARAAAWGLTATVVRRKLSGGDVPVHDPGATGRNAHPPRDAAHLLSAIASGTLPGSSWMIRTLAAQEWNDKLSTGLRPGDRFAHKTGDTSEASHDGGILDTARGARYAIVCYTRLPSSPDSDRRLGAFMRALRPELAD